MTKYKKNCCKKAFKQTTERGFCYGSAQEPGLWNLGYGTKLTNQTHLYADL